MKIDNIFPELGIILSTNSQKWLFDGENYIFRKRYGFHFPEISCKAWSNHSYTSFLSNKQFTHTSRCLIITRNPVVRFQSAFKEKILFNENFSTMNEIIKQSMTFCGKLK